MAGKQIFDLGSVLRALLSLQRCRGSGSVGDKLCLHGRETGTSVLGIVYVEQSSWLVAIVAIKWTGREVANLRARARLLKSRDLMVSLMNARHYSSVDFEEPAVALMSLPYGF